MIEQEVIAACKAEMFKRFPRSQIVIGRPAALSQYDKPYVVYGLIVQPMEMEGGGLVRRVSEAGPLDASCYVADTIAALIAASGAWFDTLRSQGSILVVRRALEWAQNESPRDEGWRYKITFRGHAANEIMLYTPDYAEKMGALAANPDLGGYIENMRKALA